MNNPTLSKGLLNNNETDGVTDTIQETIGEEDEVDQDETPVDAAKLFEQMK